MILFSVDFSKTVRMLDDEERGDVELRNQFKERWTRTPSATLIAPLRVDVKKYSDLISNAINADKVVQEKYRAHRDCIVLLSKQTVRNPTSILNNNENFHREMKPIVVM